MPGRKHAAGGVLDMFKACGVDAWPRGDFARVGDSSVAVDRAIGRPVVRLAGAVPAANSLRLPRTQEASLAAPHRFLYIQLRLEPGQAYALHADLQAGDRSYRRLTVSSLEAGGPAARSRRAGALHVFLPAAHDAWTLLAIDLEAVSAAAGGGGYRPSSSSRGGSGRGGTGHACLRALHLCANMTVRGAFTSDAKYDWHSLPPDLAFSAAFDVSQAHVLWLPAEPHGGVYVAAPRPRPASPHAALPQRPPSPPRRPRRPAAPAEEAPPSLALQPEPIAQLHRVATFSGARPRLLLWAPAGCAADGSAHPEELAFAAGSLVVAMQPIAGEPGQPPLRHRLLRGHSAAVHALALSADGGRLASAEEGAGAALRLWDFRRGCCVARVPGHAGGVTCLDLSPDSALLASAGVDAQGRQELVCWDVSACWAGCEGGARELARHATAYDVQALRLLPWDPERLVACGSNSIRLYRLKDSQLRGLSVSMDGVAAARRPYSCGTLAAPGSASVGDVFTTLAFEPALPERPLGPRRLLAGTASGALYTVSLEARAVEGVQAAHAGALHALAVHAGFCATGSADGLLRLWGSDLQEAYMEAGHEGAVTGLALSPDGLRLAVGCASGALSLLDISTQRYTTLLRSHTAGVHALSLLGQAPGREHEARQYVTGGADGTVRVWSGADHSQLLELCAPGEAVLSLACHPGKAEVACGFSGGALRVLDAAGATLVAESRQHTGAVAQLAYARHGRLLLSLGEDGCVCAYDVQRAYMPTSFLLAGFPLHATAMAVGTDGRLLATAALSLRAGSSSPGARPAGADACTMRSVLVLHDTLSLQPVLQVQLACSGRVAAVHLTPDGRHVLALTSDGRLLGYSCADGATVLDVPRCLPSPCLAAALDATGAFLVAGTAGGQLKVFALHALHQLPVSHGIASTGEGPPPAPAIIRSLPCQELCAGGSAVMAAAFLSGHQLVTTGAAGEVCCWSFLGDPCGGYAAGGSAASNAATTTGTLVVVPSMGQRPGSAGRLVQRRQHSATTSAAAGSEAPRPMFSLTADCTSRSAPAAADQREQRRQEQQVPHGPAAAGSPTPRPLPPALQHRLPPRPPSAPPALLKRPQAGASEAAGSGQRQSASLPGTPQRRSSKNAPFWERKPPPLEASLLITATPGERCTEVVRRESRLRITSPRKGGSSGRQQPRSAEWVDGEVEGDRVPAYRPQQQLRLLPPVAAVQRVCGFTSGAGYAWLPAPEGEPQRLLYAAGNVLLAEEFGAAGRQTHLARLPRDITAAAATAAGGLAAAAVQPAGGKGSTADVHLLQLGRGEGGTAVQTVLTHHSYAVQSLAFSPDGAWLASLSSLPDGVGSSLALWSVEEPAELAAGVQLPCMVAALAWARHPAGGVPTFYSAGSDGLTQWQLESEALTSSAVHLPAVLRGVPLTALACAEEEEEEEEAACSKCSSDGTSATANGGASGTVYVGDSSGRVWQLEVDAGQDVRRCQQLAEVQGRQGVSCLAAAAPAQLAVGTAGGALLLLAEEGWSGQEAAWRPLRGEQLDGAVVGLSLQAGGSGATATAATACGTLWRTAPGSAAPEVLLCGQQGNLSSWHFAPGLAWKGGAPTAAIASPAGVAVWQLDEAGSWGRSPLVEFSQAPDATHACLADDASMCAAAYSDGSICVYDVPGARMRWRAAGAAAQGGLAALAVVQRLRGCKVMAAYRSGALYLFDGASGQVAHRTLQFAVRQESGRRCPSNFPLTGVALCPTDSALFALCGRRDLLVVKAAWTKTPAVDPLARLSFGAPDGETAAHLDCEALEEAPSSRGGGGGDPTFAAPAVHAAFSRTHPGHLYVTNPASPGQVLLYDYTSREVVKTLVAPVAAGSDGAITALALHPSEALLAVGTTAGSLLLLRLESEAWAELAAHGEGGAVAGLAFSADGKQLYSAAASACATFVWEVEA